MVSREELYSLVWSTPMVGVAKKISVSGSYMARVCSILNVPRPERGHWARVEGGQAPKRPKLPPALPGEPQFWSREGGAPSLMVTRTPYSDFCTCKTKDSSRCLWNSWSDSGRKTTLRKRLQGRRKAITATIQAATSRCHCIGGWAR